MRRCVLSINADLVWLPGVSSLGWRSELTSGSIPTACSLPCPSAYTICEGVISASAVTLAETRAARTGQDAKLRSRVVGGVHQLEPLPLGRARLMAEEAMAMLVPGCGHSTRGRAVTYLPPPPPPSRRRADDAAVVRVPWESGQRGRAPSAPHVTARVRRRPAMKTHHRRCTPTHRARHTNHDRRADVQRKQLAGWRSSRRTRSTRTSTQRGKIVGSVVSAPKSPSTSG